MTILRGKSRRRCNCNRATSLSKWRGRGGVNTSLDGPAETIYVIELDWRAAEILHEKFGPRIQLIAADALTVSFAQLAGGNEVKLRIVGNIPYNITSPLLFRMFEFWHVVRDVTFMMQREVARRLIAVPRTKEYGILAVATQFYAVPNILFDVSKECFIPSLRHVRGCAARFQGGTPL